MNKKIILYVSYDGITDPVGRSQILPYLLMLQNKFHFILISLEKKHVEKEILDIKNLLSTTSIEWHPLRYRQKWPIISTIINLFAGKKYVKKIIKKYHPALVHTRSYVATWLVLRQINKKQIPLLFDMRGFWVDERVDGGLWNLKNPFYRLVYLFFKRWEQRFIKRADHLVSLTHNAAQWMNKHWNIPLQKISVIPCCSTFDLFNPALYPEAIKRELKKSLGMDENKFILGYTGSTGTWYLLDEMISFFEVLYKKNNNSVFLLLVNQLDDKKKIEIEEKKLPIIVYEKIPYSQIPAYLSIMDAIIMFIKPAFSKIASSPIKLGEALAMNKPVIINAGIGDAAYVEEDGFGFVVKDFTIEEFERIADLLFSSSLQDIRKKAYAVYDISVGVEKYTQIYIQLLNRGREPLHQ